MSAYIDISPRISHRLAVFPGDEAFRQNVSMSFEKGHHLGLSSISTTLHIGAHADAPSHYHPEGDDIAARDLNRYFGICEVLEVHLPPGARIKADHISWPSDLPKRILFKTSSFKNPELWRSDFNSLSPELIEGLAERGVELIGIDTPSVDPADSKALESHQALYKTNMSVLEGLWLEKTPVGRYLLVALPLSLEGGDASPVRAALWPAIKKFDVSS